RTYAADFFAEYFASFIGNGVYPNPSTACQVIASGNMTVALSAGQAWINGYYYHNTDNLILNLDVADGVLKRIDRIVLRYTVLNREIKAYVKKGTFASTPVAPALQRDSDVWELGVADIFIGNGVVSVSQANITDLRLNSTYCGIVHGVVIQVDTTTLFNQYQVWFSEKQTQFNSSMVNYAAEKQIEIDQLKSDFQNEFTNFMTLIQGTLSGDVAGNLLVKINENTAKIGESTDKVTSGTISTTWAAEAEYFIQTIANSNVTNTNIIEISLSGSATKAQTQAWDKLKLKDGGQTAGEFTIRCWGTKNTIDIPIVISVRGA
ncbi:MAG: hypothetical protein CVU99_10340, partial [Firmicutes bacterium HGW-Firmicutes-4]